MKYGKVNKMLKNPQLSFTIEAEELRETLLECVKTDGELAGELAMNGFPGLEDASVHDILLVPGFLEGIFEELLSLPMFQMGYEETDNLKIRLHIRDGDVNSSFEFNPIEETVDEIVAGKLTRIS